MAELNKFTIINAQSAYLLRAIQKKYSEHYTFLMTLIKLYPGKRATSEQEKVGKTIALIEETTNLINEFLGSLTPFSKEKTEELFSKMAQIDENLKFFAGQGLEKLTKAMQSRISKAEAKTNLNIENLKKVSTVMRGRVRSIVGTKPRSPLASMALEQLGSFGSGVAGTVLGPFAGIAQTGIELFKAQRARKIELQNRALASTLTLESERTNPKETGLFQSLFERNPKVPSSAASSPGLSQKGEMKINREEVGANVGDSLFTFFHLDAYRARWTFELLSTLKKIAGLKPGKSDGAKGFLGGLFANAIPKLPQMGLATLGIGLAAVTGWKAGKWLSNLKLPGKRQTVGDKIVEDTTPKGTAKAAMSGLGFNPFANFAGMFVGAQRKKELNEINKLRPEVRDALKAKIRSTLYSKASPTPTLKLPKVNLTETFKETESQSGLNKISETFKETESKLGLEKISESFESFGKSITKLTQEIKASKESNNSYGSGNFNAISIDDPSLEFTNLGWIKA